MPGGVFSRGASNNQNAMVIDLTSDDEGKTVVAEDGTEIGTVAEVRGDSIEISSDTGITEELKARLDWDTDENTGQIRAEQVAEVTDDEVRLGSEGTVGN